jgi:transcriptional regulator with XRE-family HTH domain
MSEFHSELKQAFLDPDYRAAYADSFVDAWIALQIRVVREQREMTQKDLADVLGTTQTAISRLENANYSGRSISTLKNVAKALDCRLKVSLETYGSLIAEADKFSSDFLQRPTFNDEAQDVSGLPFASLSEGVFDNPKSNEKPPMTSGIENMATDRKYKADPKPSNVFQLFEEEPQQPPKAA